MNGIRPGFRMAAQAVENCIIGGIRVAVAAPICVSMIHWKPGVIERSPDPLCSVVTCLTRCRESCRYVVWIVRFSIYAFMAGVATGRRP
jgi:hypothetical protein